MVANPATSFTVNVLNIRNTLQRVLFAGSPASLIYFAHADIRSESRREAIQTVRRNKYGGELRTSAGGIADNTETL
jgi:hypothetical protein